MATPEYRFAYNTSDSPVVIDSAGHLLGGRERGAVDYKQDAVKRAYALRKLVTVGDPGPDAAGPIRIAWEQYQALVNPVEG